MMKQLPKVIFFGNERLATGVTTTAPTLKALIEAGYEVMAVVVNNQSAVSRSGRDLEIAEVAKSHNIEVLSPSKTIDIKEKLTQLKPEAGILVAYGKIIPQTVIDLFPKGIINIHPSVLPKQRGPTPVESTILSGQTETGVSIMKLTKEMDAGPLYAQRTISVPGKISKQQLCDRLLKIGSELLVQVLSDVISGSARPKPQDDTKATYNNLISKSDSVVDWTKPASQIEKEIRAFAKWPKSIAKIGSHQVILLQVAVIKTSGKPANYILTKNELVVRCGQDSLKIIKLQPINKKEMPVKAFLAGYTL